MALFGANGCMFSAEETQRQTFILCLMHKPVFPSWITKVWTQLMLKPMSWWFLLNQCMVCVPNPSPKPLKKFLLTYRPVLSSAQLPKIALKWSSWSLVRFFFHCLRLSEQDLSGWEVGTDLTAEWGTSRVGERDPVGVTHIQWEMGRASSAAPLEGWNSSRAILPHLAGTCENNSPAFSHSADPIAISSSDGARGTDRGTERGVLIALDTCRGRSSACAILISYESCLAGEAHRLLSCLCVCAAAAAVRAAKWRPCEHAPGKGSSFHFGDFHRCFGPENDGNQWGK